LPPWPWRGAAGIAPRARAEEIPVDGFVRLAQNFTQLAAASRTIQDQPQ
jgi:hypothetical protein